jgi:hypothetical protein
VGWFSVGWATTAAVRPNSNNDKKALTLTGLPNTWIGVLVAAFEGMRMQTRLQKRPQET